MDVEIAGPPSKPADALVDTTGVFDVANIAALTKKDIEALLSRRELDAKGKLEELQARLVDALQLDPAVPTNVAEWKARRARLSTVNDLIILNCDHR